MPTPRPHYKERIAHAEGHEVQVKLLQGWTDEPEPQWYPTWEYRVKPEPKPDVVVHRRYSLVDGEVYIGPNNEPNLRLTFDGETGALKSAEVIQQS